jgi:hypothetical protein
MLKSGGSESGRNPAGSLELDGLDKQRGSDELLISAG